MTLLKAVQVQETNSRKGTTGTKICTLVSAILGKTIGVKIYGMFNLNNMFIEGAIIKVFDGRRAVGAKNEQDEATISININWCYCYCTGGRSPTHCWITEGLVSRVQ